VVSTKQVVGATLATAGVRRPTRKGCPNHAVEFKRRLAAAACKAEISVAKLALEHSINANQLFKWRREYRAGKFGVPDPTDRVTPSAAEFPVPAREPETVVTLLPVRAPTMQDGAVAAAPCIEVVFACATVRICGVPEVSSLRLVLDCLARRS
jgi:transposase